MESGLRVRLGGSPNRQYANRVVVASPKPWALWSDLWAAWLCLSGWLAREKNSADRAEPGGVLVVRISTHRPNSRSLTSGSELDWPRWRIRRWPPRRMGTKQGTFRCDLSEINQRNILGEPSEVLIQESQRVSHRLGITQEAFVAVLIQQGIITI